MYYALTPNHPYWFAKDVERKKYICKWGERERERELENISMHNQCNFDTKILVYRSISLYILFLM